MEVELEVEVVARQMRRRMEMEEIGGNGWVVSASTSNDRRIRAI